VERLELYLSELALVLRESEYLIGHIKGYVNFDNGGGVGLSIVKDKVNLKEQAYEPDTATHGFKLALTCIVFNIDEDELYNLADLGLGISLPTKAFVTHVEEEKAEESEE
jgi:hypothetical protein